MASTHIYIASDTPISQDEWKLFLKQFEEGIPVSDLSLCRRLEKAWRKCADDMTKACERIEVKLQSVRGLGRIIREKKVGGVYRVFAKHKSRKSFECFYVGVSRSSIYLRLNQHLCGDIRDLDKESYSHGKRTAYKWLSESSKVVLCYATIQRDDKE